MPLLHKLSLLVTLLVSTWVGAQLVQHKEIEAATIKDLYLQLDEVFMVTIETCACATIRYHTQAEGEYAEALQLATSSQAHRLSISSQFESILSSGYDKLSSHKVFSFQVHLTIPEKLHVYIISNIAQVEISGSLAYLEANLKNGNCTLLNHQGIANVNSYQGDIRVQTRDALVEASSRNGQVEVEKTNYPKFLLQLKTIAGDIMVEQLD